MKNLPQSGDGLRLAPLMDIFATKNHPDDTINRIVKLEQSVKEIGDYARRIDALEGTTGKIDNQFGSSFKRLDTLENTTERIDGLESTVKRIDGLERKLRVISDLEDTMKAINERIGKNGQRLDSVENTFRPQISTLENTVKAIDERVGKN